MGANIAGSFEGLCSVGHLRCGGKGGAELKFHYFDASWP